MKKIYLFIIWLPILFLFSCKSDIPEKNSLFPVTTGDLYQFIDREGKIVINPQFGKASCFRDGIALVGTSGDEPKYGFINEAGEYIIQPKYISATIFSEGICFVVEEDSPPIALSEDGKEIFRLFDVESIGIFKEGLAPFTSFDEKGESLCGFINKSGEKIIPAQFNSVTFFSDGYCSVGNKDAKWGYIDESGNVIINYQYDGAFSFNSNRAKVKFGEKWGMINKDGEYIINPQFDELVIDGNKVIIKVDEKYGWADNEGKIIINPKFDEVKPFYDNALAPVDIGGKWGYIDEKGVLKINPQFSLAFPFDDDIAVVFLNEKLGFISDEGRYIVNPQFDAISKDYELKQYNYFAFYSFIETDYFNVGAIVDRISKDFTTYDVNGINSNTTANEILSKYNLEQEDFSKNSYDVTIEKSVKLSRGAELIVKVYFLNTPWIKEQSSNWNYNYYFDGNTTVTYVAYFINLSGKGYGKGDLITEEVSKLFKNSQNVDRVSNEDQIIFEYKSGDVHLVNSSSSEVMVYKDFTVKEE